MPSKQSLNTAALNRNSFTEILALMSWDQRLVKAFHRAMDDYIAAGSPGVPLGSTDYRNHYRKIFKNV